MSFYLKNSFFYDDAKPGAIPEALAKRELALIVAQTAWGEDIIRPIIKRLIDFSDDLEVTKALQVQLDDEHRHTKLYWQHIRGLDSGFSRRLSPIYQGICDESLASEDPYELLACMLICLESFALGAFKFRRDVCADASTLQLDHAVEADEFVHLDTGMRVLEMLGRSGHVMNRAQVTNKIRKVIAVYQSRSFVEDLQSALGDEIVSPEETKARMARYFRVCGDEYMTRLQQFFRAARSCGAERGSKEAGFVQ